MQSLTSKGYVKTRFSWQYYYYNLTDEGLDYLRGWCVIHQYILFAHKLPSLYALCVKEPVLNYPYDYRLNLPPEIVPATHKKAPRPARPANVRPGGEGGAYRAPRGGGDRDEYRRRDDAGDKEGAPGEFRPRYAGVGRGAPAS